MKENKPKTFEQTVIHNCEGYISNEWINEILVAHKAELARREAEVHEQYKPLVLAAEQAAEKRGYQRAVDEQCSGVTMRERVLKLAEERGAEKERENTKKILAGINLEIVGIDEDEMTTAEKNIVKRINAALKAYEEGNNA